MRIRKNAKLSPLLFTTTTTSRGGAGGGGSVPVTTPTHVCQLNQSPWDVIPFDSDSFQFKDDDDHNSGNNGSAGDSFGAVDSAASMMVEDTEEKLKIENMVLDDDYQRGKKAVTESYGERGAARISCCQGIDERGWPCKNRVKQGQSSLLCGHHLSLLRSYNNAATTRGGSGYGKKAPHSSAVAATKRRGRPKKAPSSNPFEFYYYSGFGPRWGKRRGDRSGDGSANSGGGAGEDSTMAESEEAIVGSEIVVAADDDSDSNNNSNNVRDVVVHGIGNGVFDFVEDDDDEEDCDDDDGGGKKRMRRPVKERSLKSLM